jgi:hypothetical protein
MPGDGVRCVGWVERCETHRDDARLSVGLAPLDPPYGNEPDTITEFMYQSRDAGNSGEGLKVRMPLSLRRSVLATFFDSMCRPT